MSVGMQALQPLGRASVSAAPDGTGDARWGEHSWCHVESVPETSMNLMAAARLWVEAAPSRAAVLPEECSRRLQCEGFRFWSPPCGVLAAPQGWTWGASSICISVQ